MSRDSDLAKPPDGDKRLTSVDARWRDWLVFFAI